MEGTSVAETRIKTIKAYIGVLTEYEYSRRAAKACGDVTMGLVTILLTLIIISVSSMHRQTPISQHKCSFRTFSSDVSRLSDLSSY